MASPLFVLFLIQTAVAPSPPVAAQQAPAVQTAASAGAQADTDEYRVGPQDTLTITVYGEPQPTVKVRVDSDGTFPFEYLGRVQAEGLTLAQIEAKLRKALADGYIRNPQVSVEMDQYHSQNVYVLGEVKAPGKYSLPGNSTLIDVLTQAGSTTSAAGHWVLINHAKSGGGLQGPAPINDDTQADLKINLADVQSGKTQNIHIQDLDTIVVPKAQRIYVAGQVRTPGAFPYEENMTVFEAISLAGGVNEKGSNTRLSVRRLVGGQMKELSVKPSDTLQPGDQVNVKPRRL